MWKSHSVQIKLPLLLHLRQSLQRQTLFTSSHSLLLCLLRWFLALASCFWSNYKNVDWSLNALTDWKWFLLELFKIEREISDSTEDVSFCKLTECLLCVWFSGWLDAPPIKLAACVQCILVNRHLCWDHLRIMVKQPCHDLNSTQVWVVGRKLKLYAVVVSSQTHTPLPGYPQGPIGCWWLLQWLPRSASSVTRDSPAGGCKYWNHSKDGTTCQHADRTNCVI